MLESRLGVVVIDDERAPIIPLAQWGHGGVITRLTTQEGEYAAIAVSEDRRRGIVLGDRHYVSLDGKPNAGHEKGFDAAFRDIIDKVTLQLGVRRRRYHYVPPAGWLALPRGLTTDWIAPTLPRSTTQIRVSPAIPTTADVEVALTTLVAEVVANGHMMELGDRTELPGGFAIETLLSNSQGARLWRTWALLRSGPYLCALRLDCEDQANHPAARAVFDALLATVEPVPAPRSVMQSSTLLWSV